MKRVGNRTRHEILPELGSGFYPLHRLVLFRFIMGRCEIQKPVEISILEEERTQGGTYTCHLHPTLEGSELTFKLPFADMVMNYLKKSNGICMEYSFQFYEPLLTEVTLGPRPQENESTSLVVPAMSLQLI